MTPSRTPQDAAATAGLVPLETARQLLDQAGPPSDWNVTPGRFQCALERSVVKRFGTGILDSRKIEDYLETVHIEDLALACACSAGNGAAWDFFVAQFRPELYRAARAIAGEASARELADSLYAELFGLRDSAGARNSLFDY